MQSPLILNTRRLFGHLLRTFEIETVCDVGSMDGSDALRFRRMLPTANIIALEPNPRNFALMSADERLRRDSIRIFPLAASDCAGEAPFYVVDADYTTGRDRFRRGMSSLHRRSDDSHLAEVTEVLTVRLDELLADESLADRPIALWIDTEGMAFEVVLGASGILQSTPLVHVEVETERIIGTAQRLFADVERTLIDASFTLLATDHPTDVLQFNALFVRDEHLRMKQTEVRRYATRAQQYYRLSTSLLRSMPGRARRMLGLHLAETRCR